MVTEGGEHVFELFSISFNAIYRSDMNFISLFLSIAEHEVVLLVCNCFTLCANMT